MKKSDDWNDTLRKGGKDAVRERFDNVVPYRPGGKNHTGEDHTSEDTDKETDRLPPLKLSEWLTRTDLNEPCKLMGSLLTTTCRVIIAGPTGLGKTLLGLGAAFAIIRQENFAHWVAGQPGRVLYIDGEMPRTEIKRRLLSNSKGGAPDNLLVLSREDFEDMPPLNTERGQVWLDQFIKQHGPFALIIFDNIQSLLTGNMKDEELWAAVLPWVRSLTRRQIGQLWFHHTGHDETRSYGSKAKEWQMDTVAVMEATKVEDADVAFTLKFTKTRMKTPANKADFEDVTLMLKGTTWDHRMGRVDNSNKMTRNQKTFLSILEAAMPAGLAVEEWNEQAREAGLGVKRRMDLLDMRNRLVALKKVHAYGDRWFATKTNP
jgi:hypothetical protein